MANTHGHPDSKNFDQLRRSARDLIDHGVPPRSHGDTLSIDALRLLHERAGKAESAGDAFKLLHELQTYQVELDLMFEQLQATEHEANEGLMYYKFLYEQAPAPYLIVANDGEIVEGNQAARGFLGRSAEELCGEQLNTLMAPGQKEAINTLLQASRTQGLFHITLELRDSRRLHVSTRSAGGGDGILMILTEATVDPTGS